MAGSFTTKPATIYRGRRRQPRPALRGQRCAAAVSAAEKESVHLPVLPRALAPGWCSPPRGVKRKDPFSTNATATTTLRRRRHCRRRKARHQPAPTTKETQPPPPTKMREQRPPVVSVEEKEEEEGESGMTQPALMISPRMRCCASTPAGTLLHQAEAGFMKLV